MRPVFRDAGTNASLRNVNAIRRMGRQEQGMKAFISIDMEGVCGVVREIETDPTKGGEAYQQSRRLMKPDHGSGWDKGRDVKDRAAKKPKIVTLRRNMTASIAANHPPPTCHGSRDLSTRTPK